MRKSPSAVPSAWAPGSGRGVPRLGQAAELAKRPDEALDWYGKIDSGDRTRAQMRIATLIAKRDGLAKGASTCIGRDAHGRRAHPDHPGRAQLLRDAKAWRDTYDMLTGAVERFPDSFELLYDRAMAAERVNRSTCSRPTCGA